MIQCKDCEHYSVVNGRPSLGCDPLSTIKEPECLAKWQLVRLNQLETYVRGTINYYNRLAPMQEKMFKVLEKEIDDMSDADQWKHTDDDEDDEMPETW
jgi:hypothetical protein